MDGITIGDGVAKRFEDKDNAAFAHAGTIGAVVKGAGAGGGRINRKAAVRIGRAGDQFCATSKGDGACAAAQILAGLMNRDQR